MKRLRKILKWVAIALACVVVGIQFVGPAKSNPTVNESQAVHAHLQISDPVNAILDRSCNDCHSNRTKWPWYSHVAPVSWFVIDHVNEGRRHLNFSEWGQFNKREAGEMLDEICREVKKGSMPLSSYTPLHPGSKLASDDIKTLCDWSAAEQERLESL